VKRGGFQVNRLSLLKKNSMQHLKQEVMTVMSFTNLSQTGKITANPSILPKHILIGYWHNWHTSPAAFIPLREVSDHFDVINVAFATSAGTDDGRIVFPPYQDPKQFESDVAYMQSLGKKVVISIGGANGSVAVDNLSAQDRFTDSVVRLVRQYGFDGIDINLENKVILEKGDTDFRSPTSASIRHLTAAIRAVRNNFGPEFILSLAPEAVNVQGGFSAYERFSGSYLPVIHELRDILTYLQVQHYNSKALMGRDRNIYTPGTADFHVAMAEMLLQGFMIPVDTEQSFPPLQPEQVVIGLAAFPEAVNGGYTAPLETQKVLAYLSMGKSFCGTYRLHDSIHYASLRGIMTWSINWDAANRYQFSNAIRRCLDALP
jgi:chitinase